MVVVIVVMALPVMMYCRDAVLVTIAFALSQGIPEAFYPVFDLDLAPVGVSDRNIGLISDMKKTPESHPAIKKVILVFSPQ